MFFKIIHGQNRYYLSEKYRYVLEYVLIWFNYSTKLNDYIYLIEKLFGKTQNDMTLVRIGNSKKFWVVGFDLV